MDDDSSACQWILNEDQDYWEQPAEGIEQEHHDRLVILRGEALRLGDLMHAGEISDIDALASLMDFAAPMYGDDVDGFLTDLGIVVGGLDATGFIPDVIDDEHTLSQYYVGYETFDPEDSEFRYDLNRQDHNQVRHFLAGSSIMGNLGVPGIAEAMRREEAPEDDALYAEAIDFVLFLRGVPFTSNWFGHPLSDAGNWVRDNLRE